MKQLQQTRAIRGRFRSLLASTLLIAVGPVLGAGGHHAVDDAALMEAGQCELESWAERHGRERPHLLHVGQSCRVGAFELGLNLERTRMAPEPVVHSIGPQVKWAHPLSKTFAVGAVLSATWDLTPSRAFSGGTVFIPMTWQAHEAVALHVNAGRDFRQGERDTGRLGAALEWAVSSSWAAIAERYREQGASYARLGARWIAPHGVTVDLSRTHEPGAAQAHPWWTFGVGWVFER